MPNHNDRNKWTTSFVVQNMLYTKIMPRLLKYIMCLKNSPTFLVLNNSIKKLN